VSYLVLLYFVDVKISNIRIAKNDIILSISMYKKIIILILISFGLSIYSNNTYACNKPHKSKSTTSFVKLTKVKAKSNCCKSHNNNSGHDCNKKCNHHNCACTSICLNNYICKKEVVIETVLYITTQRQYNIYKPSFYNDVHISIWHPPKIA
jgi:hypothetical protein